MVTDSILIHLGVGHDDNPPGRGSGRFAYGSGDNPYQHQFTFLSEVKKLRGDGLKDSEIAKMLVGERATVTQLRAAETIAKNEIKKYNHARAVELLDKYKGNLSAVAREMGENESTLRGWMKEDMKDRRDRYSNTADMLKQIVDEKGMVNVSKFTELYLGVPAYTKDVAISMLEREGYTKATVKIPQMGTTNETTVTVLAKPGISWAEIQQNKFDVQPIATFTPDEGKTWWTPEFPTSVDSKRIMIRYDEEGGSLKDGVIELKRGVEDISLGPSQYAQVRVAVDGTNYMKGMAMYADDKDFPPGIDIIYNTNKSKGTPAINKDAVYNPETGEWTGKEVLKRLKIDNKTGEVDKDNPFGALIKSPKDRDGVLVAGGQRHYTDKNGKDQLSPINKLQDEGDWDSWSRNLASQFLSKQPLKLINQQIDYSLDKKKAELQEILQLTNPVVKKKLLDGYATDCDANAADLSVKGFKNQAFQVILPIPDLKDNEIYAPNFEDGDTVALIRYPHGGTFEIPILKVNNKHKTAKNVMRNASDAVGINAENAERLSGADFDGDTVVVIPLASNNIDVVSTPKLKQLEGWDPKKVYKLPDSDKRHLKGQAKQTEMGKITNLITDMTVAGAPEEDIVRAVKHSMVVIDAEKHHLDWNASFKDNRISELKKEYQGGEKKGASTILSKAHSKIYVDEFKEVNDLKKMIPEEQERWKQGYQVLQPTGHKIKRKVDDPSVMTAEELQRYNAGKKVYRESDEYRQTKVTRMSQVDDAMDLVFDKSNPKEVAYANYANELKALAREARKEYRSIKPTPVNQESKRTYAEEVASLDRKLRTAEMNNPREAQAQTIANNLYREKKNSNPDMDFEHQKRAQSVALQQARAMVGASKERINITDREWEAIQANAISNDKLARIVNNSNLDILKERATPRNKPTSSSLTANQMNLIKQMSNSNLYSQSDIAKALGISTSLVSEVIRNEAKGGA